MYRKSNLFNIVFMLFLLAFVFVMIYIIDQQRHRIPALHDVLDKFEGSAKVINQTYYNRPFRFSLSVPDSSWEFTYIPEVDSSILYGSSDSEPGIVAEIQRIDASAILKIGIYRNEQGLNPESLAFRNLQQIQRQFKAMQETISVVADVTIAGSGDLTGAFFVLELPEKSHHPYPVWIHMDFKRDQLAYHLFCQVRQQDYEALRTNIENILKSFRFIY